MFFMFFMYFSSWDTTWDSVFHVFKVFFQFFVSDSLGYNLISSWGVHSTSNYQPATRSKYLKKKHHLRVVTTFVCAHLWRRSMSSATWARATAVRRSSPEYPRCHGGSQRNHRICATQRTMALEIRGSTRSCFSGFDSGHSQPGWIQRWQHDFIMTW